MIFCDTTATNTGRLNGVIVQVQKQMSLLGLEKPQYIACQHHVLDTILKHVLNFFLQLSATKPEL